VQELYRTKSRNGKEQEREDREEVQVIKVNGDQNQQYQNSKELELRSARKQHSNIHVKYAIKQHSKARVLEQRKWSSYESKKGNKNKILESKMS